MYFTILLGTLDFSAACQVLDFEVQFLDFEAWIDPEPRA
jgi:hypothetical protein